MKFSINRYLIWDIGPVILKTVPERKPDQSEKQSIYTIDLELLQIIAFDTMGRKLSISEIQDVQKTIAESMYENLVDCIEATLRFRNSQQILGNDKLRGYPLIPQDVRNVLPPLYSNELQGKQAKSLVKFFLPGSYWTWYASEFDGQDTFFGLVVGHHIELGYFSYKELACLRGSRGQVVERDFHYEARSLEALQSQHETERN